MSANCATWRSVRRKNPNAAPRPCLAFTPCDCGSDDCCECGWPVASHPKGGP